jgi:hypothetical protein
MLEVSHASRGVLVHVVCILQAKLKYGLAGDFSIHLFRTPTHRVEKLGVLKTVFSYGLDLLTAVNQ